MSGSTFGKSETGSKESNDLALVKLVRSGDRGAFSELYRQYHPRLFAYLRRLIANPATVEEVLDDVMLVVWMDARKYRGTAAVSSWIFGIAYRKALTAIRAECRHQAPLDRIADSDAIAGETTRDDEWIQTALKQLSPDHRQVVELTYFGGFSYREIANIANCPVNTVKTRMFHARRRLKVLLPALAGQWKERTRELA